MCVCSYTCIGGPFGYFIGFFYLPLFSTLIPRSVRKKVRSLRRLPPDRDIKFQKESPVFVVRISSTSKPATQYSSSMGSSNHHPLLGLWHLYTYSPNRLWSSAGRTTSLPEHETNHKSAVTGDLKQPHILHLGLKQTYSHNITGVSLPFWIFLLRK